MARERRYGVFCKRTHNEVHGIGASTKREMQEWIDAIPGYYIATVEVTDLDRELGYVPVPA